MPENLLPVAVRFENFELLLQSGELQRFGIRIRLPRQSFKILSILLERSGQIVTRDDLRKNLWPADTFVDFEHGLNSAVKRLRVALNDSAEQPRFIETLPRLGYRYIGPPVTESQSIVAKQSSGAASSIEIPLRSPEPVTLPEARPAAKVRLPVLRSAGFACLALIGVALAFDLAGTRQRMMELLRRPLSETKLSTASAAVIPRPSIAVFGLKNLTGRTEDDWLSTALSEMLTTEVGAGERLRVIPGENIARMKTDLRLPDADSYTGESLTRIRQSLGCDMVVLGSFTALGEKSGARIRLDLRMQNAVTGETMAVLSAAGTEDDLFELVSGAGEELRAKAGIGPVPTGHANLLEASLPHDPQAARSYADGINKLRAYDNLAARRLLERATALEPKFALAHAALASAWSRLGYDANATKEAKTAFDLSADLDREERLWVEGQYRETAKEWDSAIGIYHDLYESFPDNLEYGLRLASAQISGGKGRDGLRTVQGLRRLPDPSSGDPRIDQLEAVAENSMGDYESALAAAAKAATKGRAHKAALVEATALREECWDYQQLGKLSEAIESCRRAEQLYAEAGDLDRLAQTHNSHAAALWTQGDLPGAKAGFEEALSIFRRVGDKASMAVTISNIASILSLLGDLNGSREMYEETMAIDAETQNKSGVAADLQNIGTLLIRLGDLKAADRAIRHSLTISEETGNQFYEAAGREQLAQSLYFQGDLAQARNTLSQAEAVFRATGNKEGLSVTLENQGQLSAAEGDLNGAQQKYTESLDAVREADDKEVLAETQLDLANLLLEEGRHGEAEELCGKALQEFMSSHNQDDELLAHAGHVEALLAEGKFDEAKAEIRLANPLAATTQNQLSHLKFAVATGDAQALAGSAARARETLRSAISQAEKYGFLGYAFDARLALGKAELKSGNTTDGVALLAALEKDATTKGFLFIARQARAVADQSLRFK